MSTILQMDDTALWADASFGEPVFMHDNSEYIINYGVKVSRDIMTYRLSFKNTRIGGDFYGPLTEDQEYWIRSYGFEIGARLTSIHTMIQIVKEANVFIQKSKSAIGVEKMKSRRTKLLQDIKKHYEKINDIKHRKLDNESSLSLQEVIVGVFDGKFDFGHRHFGIRKWSEYSGYSSSTEGHDQD